MISYVQGTFINDVTQWSGLVMFNSVDLGKHKSDPETGVCASGSSSLALVCAEVPQDNFFSQKRCCVIPKLDCIRSRLPSVTDKLLSQPIWIEKKFNQI